MPKRTAHHPELEALQDAKVLSVRELAGRGTLRINPNLREAAQ